jgi:hypothetical protein
MKAELAKAKATEAAAKAAEADAKQQLVEQQKWVVMAEAQIKELQESATETGDWQHAELKEGGWPFDVGTDQLPNDLRPNDLRPADSKQALKQTLVLFYGKNDTQDGKYPSGEDLEGWAQRGDMDATQLKAWFDQRRAGRHAGVDRLPDEFRTKGGTAALRPQSAVVQRVQITNGGGAGGGGGGGGGSGKWPRSNMDGGGSDASGCDEEKRARTSSTSSMRR